MGWKWKREVASNGSRHLENLIGSTARVQGELVAEGGFRIDGKVEGGVQSGGIVVVGKTGIVQGDVRGSDVVVVGRIEGNIFASGHLDIGAGGVILGDVCVRSFRMETGGVFRGMSRMTLDFPELEAKDNASDPKLEVARALPS